MPFWWSAGKRNEKQPNTGRSMAAGDVYKDEVIGRSTGRHRGKESSRGRHPSSGGTHRSGGFLRSRHGRDK